MKLTDEFDAFLKNHVDLNDSRIKTLQDRVNAIAGFLNDSDWVPRIKRYSAQGSWAHKTIIKPPGNRGFDADLLVFVDPVDDWSASDYITDLRRVFRASGVYREKCSLNNRCVTISYANDFEIDIVPCVVSRPQGKSTLEVCNRVDDVFEPTDSEAYTAWLDQRNAWIGSDRLREVTRLLKYLRDIKYTFSCKSILMTTLLGERVTLADALYPGDNFADLPTSLRTLVGRLDDYLQAHPDLHEVKNPVLPQENFIRHWDDDKYDNFRTVIHRYREWIEDAYGDADEAESRKKWQKIFGDDFGKTQQAAAARAEDAALLPVPAQAGGSRLMDIVEAVKSAGSSVLARVPAVVPWMKPAVWRMAPRMGTVMVRATAHEDRSGRKLLGEFPSGAILRKGLELRFEALSSVGMPLTSKELNVQWQVVNSDEDAWRADGLRGGFYESKPRGVRWETTQYRGVHWIQAFVIRKRDRLCVGRSERFFVIVE